MTLRPRKKLQGKTSATVKKTLREAAPSAQDTHANRVRMINACKTGDAKRVRQLLKQDPSLVEFENPIGRFAPLHYAARAGHAAVVKALLKAGADPNPFEHMLRNHCGITTVEIARLRGYKDVVALLETAIGAKHGTAAEDNEIRSALKARDLAQVLNLVRRQPELVHAADDDGNTPLHCVAQMRPANLEWLDALLQSGADPNAPNALGLTPLHVSLFRNHLWTNKHDNWLGAGYLLAHGADYDICIAAAAGDIEFVRAHLEEDPVLANFQDTMKKRPLSNAIEFGHFEIARLLLEHGADPNAPEASPFKTYPLVAAVDHDNLELVKFLLERGADPEAYVDSGGGALYHALDRGFNDIADLLASYGASLSASDYAWRCDLPVLSALLKANPSLAPELLAYNDESKPEKSAMVVEMAFKHGADPKQVGAWTLYRACRTPALLKVFLEHGVDPNTADNEGKTTLHGMNRFPGSDGAAVLLDYGADINARDDVHQATPLAWAVMFGNLEMVQLLLSRGAAPNLPDDEPWATPLFWAEHKGHTEIAALLREHGATH
jgi:ankyrin repeat protein